MPQSLRYPIMLPDGVVYWSPGSVEYPADHPYSMQQGVIENLRAQIADANKRIEDAEKQKPVAEKSLNGMEWQYANTVDLMPCGTKLYTAPIPSPDVAELIASESEACAKVCEERARNMIEIIRTANPRTSEHIMLRREARFEESKECAAEIRARNAKRTGD